MSKQTRANATGDRIEHPSIKGLSQYSRCSMETLILRATTTTLVSVSILAIALVVAAGVPNPARGQAAIALSPETAPARDIGTVSARGGPSALSAEPAPGTAAFVAPSRAPLDTAQPASVVGQRFIERNVVPTQNYDSIIKFSPSVHNVEPVGAGLQQNFMETIRGFTYKQFNTTFDGLVLPGTQGSFAPQSEAYFMAHDIGSVRIDRGPGSASTIGYATFGGNVDIRSKAPQNSFTLNPYTTIGSFGTWLRGFEVDTGVLPQLNGARGFIDLSAVDGGGYLTNTTTRRRNGFTKLEVPAGDSTLITFVSMLNTSFNNTPIGATLNQIRAFGPDYGLNGDPKSQAFKFYNKDWYTADFEYLRIRSDLGDGWGIEFTPYTASYYHRGTVGEDPNGTTANLTGTFTVNGVPTKLTNNVPGRSVHSDFRTWGMVLRGTRDTDFGQARAGVWFDYNAGNDYRTYVVLDMNNAAYIPKGRDSPFDRAYHTSLTTTQPYFEFALKQSPDLVITPGIKFTSFTRDLDAKVNVGTRVPARYTKDYSAIQPSIDVRYTFMPSLVGYAQIAKGFLAPPLNVLQTLTPQELKPQETWNYQAGVTWQNDWLTLSGDVYYIDFGNRIASQKVGVDTLFFNGGGAIYQGFECEGTVRLGGGVSLYGNASLNETHYRGSTVQLANAPDRTASFGVIYDRDGLSAALIGKYVGKQYGQDTAGPTVGGIATLQNAFPIRSYMTADFAMGYTLGVLNGRKVDFRLNVNNIFDDHSLIALNTTTAAGAGLYWTNPGRSVFFTLSASL